MIFCVDFPRAIIQLSCKIYHLCTRSAAHSHLREVTHFTVTYGAKSVTFPHQILTSSRTHTRALFVTVVVVVFCLAKLTNFILGLRGTIFTLAPTTATQTERTGHIFTNTHNGRAPVCWFDRSGLAFRRRICLKLYTPFGHALCDVLQSPSVSTTAERADPPMSRARKTLCNGFSTVAESTTRT